MSQINYTWTEYYMELADKLLKYKNNRKKLIKICEAFDNINMKLAKLDLTEVPSVFVPSQFLVFSIKN